MLPHWIQRMPKVHIEQREVLNKVPIRRVLIDTQLPLNCTLYPRICVHIAELLTDNDNARIQVPLPLCPWLHMVKIKSSARRIRQFWMRELEALPLPDKFLICGDLAHLNAA